MTDREIRAARLSTSRICDLLADPRRRTVLYCLVYDDDDEIDFETLATGAWRLHRDLIETTERESLNDLAMGLWHSALPRLAAVGVVSVDKVDETVTYSPVPALEDWIAFAAQRDFPPSHPIRSSGRLPTDVEP